MTFHELIASETPESFLTSAQPFVRLMMQYKCAMMEVQTKFEVLNLELSVNGERNPIESISSRIKKPVSIIAKLKRKRLPVTLESIETYLHDVAGIRVICSFPKDIYRLAEEIASQDDIRVLEEKDYIAHPKDNGYRSLHLILEVPVFFEHEKKWMQVEVQFRTIAMDFWASIEHKLQYKSNADTTIKGLADRLCLCAERIHAMDLEMQKISDEIARFKEETDAPV